MSGSSYEEVMSELENLDEGEQEAFAEALDSRLERRIQINEEQQQLNEESALDRDEPFGQEEFTYFQDTAKAALKEYRNNQESIQEHNQEYVRRLARTNKILEDSGQEADVMDWINDLDKLVYSIAESERQTRSQFERLDSIQEKHHSKFEEFTYQALRGHLDVREYDQFLEYVKEAKQMEEIQEFNIEENIPDFEGEMDISGEDYEKMKEEAERSINQTKERLETYLAAVPEEVANRAPRRYKEAIYSGKFEENSSEYEPPTMKEVVETDFAAALEEVKS